MFSYTDVSSLVVCVSYYLTRSKIGPRDVVRRPWVADNPVLRKKSSFQSYLLIFYFLLRWISNKVYRKMD